VIKLQPTVSGFTWLSCIYVEAELPKFNKPDFSNVKSKINTNRTAPTPTASSSSSSSSTGSYAARHQRDVKSAAANVNKFATKEHQLATKIQAGRDKRAALVEEKRNQLKSSQQQQTTSAAPKTPTAH
jgi:hypothetical protein